MAVCTPTSRDVSLAGAAIGVFAGGAFTSEVVEEVPELGGVAPLVGADGVVVGVAALDIVIEKSKVK